MSDIKVYQRLDLNRWPQASEATALPTEPQPLSTSPLFFVNLDWLRFKLPWDRLAIQTTENH